MFINNIEVVLMQFFQLTTEVTEEEQRKQSIFFSVSSVYSLWPLWFKIIVSLLVRKFNSKHVQKTEKQL
jgi:hypothetical protein